MFVSLLVALVVWNVVRPVPPSVGPLRLSVDIPAGSLWDWTWARGKDLLGLPKHCSPSVQQQVGEDLGPGKPSEECSASVELCRKFRHSNVPPERGNAHSLYLYGAGAQEKPYKPEKPTHWARSGCAVMPPESGCATSR